MDCREGKELKQETCRYVKKCKPGWTRNEKFICRKTARRVQSPNLQKMYAKQQNQYSNQPANESELEKQIEQTKPKSRTKKTTFLNQTSKKTKKPRSKKTKVGNYITYTHPDGRKERAKVTGMRDGKYELHIPSLGDEWVKQGAARFKKGETVFYMYRTGMREKAIVKRLINGGEMYEVYLTSQQIHKTVPEKKLRKLDSFEENIPKGFSYTTSHFKKGELVNYVHSNGMKEQARIEKVINDGELYQVYLFTDDETVTVAESKLRKLDSFNT